MSGWPRASRACSDGGCRPQPWPPSQVDRCTIGPSSNFSDC
jgi:hypothetical protein